MVEAVRVLLTCLALLALPSALRAHQLDEYLQSTLVVIEPASIRLQMILTPGVAIAEKVMGLMDGNADGVLSTEEGAAYAALLKRDLHLQLDGRELELRLTQSAIPTPEELRSGAAILQMEFSATPGPLAAGTHALALENRHQAEMSVYLINAAKPRSAEVQIVKQMRNAKQSTVEIEFVFQPVEGPFRWGWSLAVLGGLLVAQLVWRRRILGNEVTGKVIRRFWITSSSSHD